jgi:hypothetical protein
MGSGDIDFKNVISSVGKHQTFIVETWQGHKDSGAGFKRDLLFLNKCKEAN